ncbi:MAG: SDR family oxidoreductase [Candidatus Yanofskybacteria bacterium]|nr:SDR family oxidoreductase [Candidatus Yanofskybacteria bacterium]
MSHTNQAIVTGASGLLGSQLLQNLKSQNYETLAVFNQNPELVSSGVKKINCDIRDKKAVWALKNLINPSALIIHCAAITNVDLCEKEKEMCEAVNIGGTRNVCELARQTDSKIIYISTASVFDGKAGNYKETDTASPVNCYNLSKVKGEEIISSYEKGIIVRVIPLGLHLSGRKPSSFLEWLVDSFRNNLDVNIFTDVKINPLTVTTVADMVIKAAALMESGLLHLGSRDVVSKAEVGIEVAKFFPKYKGKIHLASLEESSQNVANRPKEMWLNVDKALSLGLELPMVLPDINQYLKYFKWKKAFTYL